MACHDIGPITNDLGGSVELGVREVPVQTEDYDVGVGAQSSFETRFDQLLIQPLLTDQVVGGPSVGLHDVLRRQRAARKDLFTLHWYVEIHEVRANRGHGICGVVGEDEEPLPSLPYSPYDPRASYLEDRKSTRLNSSHQIISYAVFCLKKKRKKTQYSH